MLRGTYAPVASRANVGFVAVNQRRSVAAIEVTVRFGSKTCQVTGRAGLLLAWIVVYAERINATSVD